MNGDMTQGILGDKGVRRAVLSVLIFLALFLVVQSISTVKNYGRSDSPATDVITVSGEGQATLAPDVARVSFTVQNNAPAVADAQIKTTEQANAALDFVKEQGIDEKDIKTLAYNITPQYSYASQCALGVYCPATPKVTGYQVSETVQVTLRDLTKVGEMLAGLGKLSVQNVSGPAFALDDSTAGYDAARADAIEKAKSQARLLAKQLGVKLGKIVNYNESSGGFPYPMMGYAMGGDFAESKAALVPDVPVGENTYNATVSITYEIR